MSSRLPDPIEIFVDRCLGRRIGEPLSAAGAVVHLHDDHFEEGVDDEEWLTEVGNHGWIVLTKDQKIRYRTIEREALMDAGLRAFFFMSGNVPFAEMAQMIADALPKMEKLIADNDPPFIAGIYKDSSVKLILSRKK